MAGFLGAHGYEPGPTQRPLLAGAIAGLLATIPAIPLLYLFGSLEVEARIIGASVAATLAAGCLVMAAAGALYARLFGRAANDVRGGWLFGMAFGFALWTAGAVFLLPIVSDGLTPAGVAAVGVFLSLILWGLGLGALVPFVHRPLHQGIKEAAQKSLSGPNVATTKRRMRK
jgi:hypothetical protein